MKKVLSLFLICGFVTTSFAAEAPDHTDFEPNRFLFVVENSSAMSRSAKAAQKVVRELIESGVQGEMRTGDTFGVWTFDEQLNMTLPVQHWSSGASTLLGLKVEDFLKQHRYENKGPLSTALPKVYSLIKDSKSITVILVTTGTEPIRGTPFDAEINAIYPQYARELREAKIPFVTVLIGYHGRPVAYSVNSSIGIQIPQPLRPKKLAQDEKTNAVAAASTVEPPKAVTNKVTTPDASPVAPGDTKTKAKEAAIAAPVIPTSTPIIAPQVALSTDSEAPKVLDASIKTKPPELANESSATVPPKPNKAPTQIQPVEKVEAAPPTNAVVASIPVEKSAEQQPTAVTPPAPEVASVEARSTDAPAAAPEPVVAAAQPAMTAKTFLFAGVGLVVVAGLLVFLLFRQSGKSRPSLISHSLQQKK